MVARHVSLLSLIAAIALNVTAQVDPVGPNSIAPTSPRKIGDIEGVEGGGLYLDGRGFSIRWA